ncbi:MAG: hypothetical protein MOGMAGMI_00469 [Candidatus Omnitrophica bacterium]|nr:hypothetical protein [Candidatus Omnitrophota bacterium]
MIRWSLCAAAVLAALGAAHPVFAVPEKCVVVISRVDLKRADGTWVRAARPDKPVDIASGEARVMFVNAGRRPLSGDYVNFRIVLEGALTYRGSVDGRASATASADVVLGPGLEPRAYRERPLSSASEDGSVRVAYLRGNEDPRSVEFVLGASSDLDEPIALKRGSVVGARFAIDVSSVLAYRASSQLPGVPGEGRVIAVPPRVTGAWLTVDEREYALAAEAVRLTAVDAVPSDENAGDPAHNRR